MGAILSFLSGGVLRLLPEVMNFFDRKNERKHELDMTDKQIALKQAEAASALAVEHEKHDAAVDAGMIQALVEATKAQGVMTGNKWVDGLNMLVRPMVTYCLFGMYAAVRLTIVVTGIATNPHDWAKVLVSTWTPADMEMLSGVIGYWFVSRKFDREK